jgi:protein-S-isoprenylcysteine O-methyltransferase Ste14
VTASTIGAYILMAVFFGMEGRLRKGSEAKSLERGKDDQKSTATIGMMFLVLGISLIAGPVLNALQIGRLPVSDTVGWLGVLMMAAGIGLRIWATRVLGAFYTRTLRITNEHRVVMDGPYRVIRHPGYAGTLLTVIGAGIATLNIISIVAIIVAAIYAYHHRMASEEKMLADSFGDEYRQYMIHTRRIIPFIY